MIARPKNSRNERKTTEIGAFEVGHVALFCRPGADESMRFLRPGLPGLIVVGME
jgi:hypothetical protein